MQRLGDGAEGHGLAARLKTEQPVHRRRPVHMAAGEVPAPDAAAGQRLGQLLGERAVIRARRRRARDTRGRPPSSASTRPVQTRRVISRLASRRQSASAAPTGWMKASCASVCGDVAHRDDGVGAVEQRQAQHAGLGAEGGERLLRPENGEQIAGARAVERRAGLDLAFGIGEERHAAVERSRPWAGSRRARPASCVLELSVLSLRLSAALSAISASCSARRIECRALAVDQLEGEADQRRAATKTTSSSGTRRRSSSALGRWRPTIARRSCQCGPANAKSLTRGTRPRHSVPLLTFSCFEPENCRISELPFVIGIDEGVVCPEKNCGKSVNNPLTRARTLGGAQGFCDDLVAVGGERFARRDPRGPPWRGPVARAPECASSRRRRAAARPHAG